MTNDERQELARVIGWRLKCARLWAGLPIQAAADRLEVHRQTLAAYEASAWHLTVITFWRATTLYNVDPAKLLRGVDEPWEREKEEGPAGG